MTITELVQERLGKLPEDKQRAVLAFVEREIKKTEARRGPLFDPYGLWAHAAVDITEDDIALARLEAWGDFPREDL